MHSAKLEPARSTLAGTDSHLLIAHGTQLTLVIPITVKTILQVAVLQSSCLSRAKDRYLEQHGKKQCYVDKHEANKEKLKNKIPAQLKIEENKDDEKNNNLASITRNPIKTMEKRTFTERKTTSTSTTITAATATTITT